MSSGTADHLGNRPPSSPTPSKKDSNVCSRSPCLGSSYSTLSISSPDISSTHPNDIEVSFHSNTHPSSLLSHPITLTSPASPLPRKSTKNKCKLENCNNRVVKIVGDCRYCEGNFCSNHRLPESHYCPNLSTCKQLTFDKFSNKLMSEKCVANKL